MKQYAYLFEAHSIQSYVMNGGKLAEMIGASELLEKLLDKSGPLFDVFDELGFSPSDYQFSRLGGGAFYLLFNDKEKAEALSDLWPLVVAQFAPSLPWNHAIAEGDSQKQAIENGKESLRKKRNQPQAVLPEANPLIYRSPRTGFPAVGKIKDPKDSSRKISVDAASKAKQAKAKSRKSLLFNKFLSEDTQEHWKFPRNLDREEGDDVFPFNGDNHTIAILHADGNGLGEMLINLSEKLPDTDDYAATFFKLSEKIDQATRDAAKKALLDIEEIKQIKDILPVRPLILGGDDLTLIIRGDLALDYARNFLTHFEVETAKQLKDFPLIKKGILPDQMTACAGIAFVRSNQPFYLAYRLAESLCEHAKNSSRATNTYKNKGVIPSSLAFYHVTTSMIDQYADVQAQELTTLIGGDPHILSLGAYGIGKFSNDLADFTALEELKNKFQEKAVARGSARHILTLLHVNPDDAKTAYARWREIMRGNDINKSVLELFDRLGDEMLGGEICAKGKLPFANFSLDKDNPQYRSFLGDLNSWLAIQGEQQ